MATLLGRFVLALLLLVGAVASAQADLGDSAAARQRPSAVLLANAGEPHAYRLATGAVAAVGRDAPLLATATPIGGALNFDHAVAHQGLAARVAPLEMKNWMLVALGIFLIIAIGQRRYHSMLD